jgi:hypothetical protein
MPALLREPDARAVVIPLDGPEIQVSGLRITFQVTRTADQEPNAGEVTFYNLAARTRALISGAVVRPPVDDLAVALDEITASLSPYRTGAEASGPPSALAKGNGYAYVRLSAGYKPVLSTVLEGTSTRARSRPMGVDWLTTLSFTDALATLNHAAVNRTFERGEPVFAAVQHLVRVMGLRPGNVDQATWNRLDVFEGGGPLSGAQYFGASYSPQGDPAFQLSTLLRDYQIRWILDEGAVWLLGPAGYLPGPPVDLTPREVPEETETGLLVRSEFNGLVRPGARVNLRSSYVPGLFFVQAVRHGGDTFGELSTEVEVTSLGKIPGVF